MKKGQNKIKTLIYQKYKSEAELAKQLAWPRQKLNKITTGSKEPDLQEVNDLAGALSVPVGELVNIFLQS